MENGKSSKTPKKAHDGIEEISTVTMQKKTSSKASHVPKEETFMEQGKRSKTPKKAHDEIDQIFSNRKRKNHQEQEKAKRAEHNVDENAEKTKKKKKKNNGIKERLFADTHPQPRKRTKDGLSVYTEEELGINRQDAGGTPLCPFDCSCCF
ncbi:hypothetical protein Nepgr_000938 [Nepenthes gracilis]|uniref:DUF1764 domain-containing protein n=1 Tax=Nepenthes gracilis TaxID=150966 RepID=A0AAD3P3N1_NEPGR|nr:hypothetical protein Nepgr_000938 [Nepenthes gracilis]